MKYKILIAAFILFCSFTGPGDPPEVGVSFNSFWRSKSVAIAGYTKINARYEWVAGAFDSGLHVPQYNGVPSGLRSGVWAADGAVAVDTVNHRFYIYSGGAWLRVANYSEIGTTYTSSNGITLTGSNFKLGGTLVDATTTVDINGNDLVFVDAGATRLSMIAGTTDLFSPSEGSNLSLNDNYGQLSGFDSLILRGGQSLNNGRIRLKDSIHIYPPLGNLYIDTLNYTLSTTGKKIMLRDTATGLVQNIDPLLLAQEAANFADTTNFKPVVINTTGTSGTIGKIYKATYWPGGGGGGGGATVGTYSTRIGLSPSNGDEFFQTDIGRDAPDGKYYYLNSKWHYQPIRPETLTTFWNEFQSITTNQGYLDNGLIGWSGNSGSISFPSAPTLPGVAIFNTSTTTNGYAGFYGGAINNPGAWVMFDKGNCYFKTYINIPTLSDGTDTYSFRIGLGNGLLGDFSNGVYFEYSSATSANWLIKTANYTTRTSTTSGTAVATGWHTLEILTNSNGTSVEYWVDGTSLGTITTNIPGSGNAQNPTMIMQKSAGTNSRSIQVDYVKAWQRLTTQRD